MRNSGEKVNVGKIIILYLDNCVFDINLFKIHNRDIADY